MPQNVSGTCFDVEQSEILPFVGQHQQMHWTTTSPSAYQDLLSGHLAKLTSTTL
jgi:hypothetical protein